MSLTAVTGGFAVANIAAVEVVTEETTPKEYLLKTASEASLKAAISSGEEKELRKRNTIIAVNKKLDIVKGYDVTLKDLLINPKIHALLQGGVATDAENAFSTYTDPVTGSPVTRTPFTLNIYCENVGTDGETSGYLKFSLTKCKGKPCDFDLKDDEFYSPSYTIESRPASGTTPLTISKVTELPTAA